MRQRNNALKRVDAPDSTRAMAPDTDLALAARGIRRAALAMIYRAGSGHPGGALSAADLLAHLYFKELSWNPSDPYWPARDRFILSKGHSCPSLYAALGLRGCFGPDPEAAWKSFRKIGGKLQGHPHVLDVPWVEASTGSLGQGFSVGIGMAMGLRHLGESPRVYVMLGDGEMQEGEVWEGAMCAGHHGLDNLCAILDYNKMQSDDRNERIVGLEPLREKWEAFRWHVIEIDGHDHGEIDRAFAEARATRGKPVMILAHTIKGKGVPYMEDKPLWHGSVKLRDEDLRSALEALEASEAEILHVLGKTGAAHA